MERFKELICFVFLVLISNISFTQQFYVSAIRGNIFANQKLLKKGDTVNFNAKIFSDSRDNKLRITNETNGSYLITFNTGQLTVSNAERRSELYELTIQHYINKFEASRALTTKGDFDWLKFFLDSLNQRMVIIENQKIPMVSKEIILDTSARFFCMLYFRNDSSRIELKFLNNSLFFPPKEFPVNTPFTWSLYVTFNSEEKKRTEQVNDKPLEGYFLSLANLNEIVEDYKQSIRSPNKNNIGVFDSIMTFISMNYGAYCKPYLEPLVWERLGRR